MKRFDERVQFQGSAQSQGFSPIQTPDVTPLLRQNMETQRQSLDNVRQAGLQQMELNKLTNLAQFSETLSNTIVEGVKRKNLADEEEGLMLAYTDGLPEEQVQQFDQSEKTIIASETAFKTVASTVEQAGAPVDVVRQYRDLGGWKAYGYARGMAEQAAANYPRFYQQASETTAVNINGQEITLATAKTSPERAAVEAQIRNQYLSRFVGVNPALLNKYLFPSIRQYENRAAIEWSETQQALLKEERKSEAQDMLYNGIKAARGGETLIEFIQRFQGDFGGLGASRKTAVDLLEGMIRGRQIGQAEVDSILEYEFQSNDGSTRKIGEYWGRDFVRIKDLLYEASRTDLQQAMASQQDAQSEFKLFFDEQTSQRRNEGRDWSEAELRAVADDYEAKGLGPAPDWLKNYMSKEDRLDESDKERLLDLRRSRGYLTEEDLRSVSAKLYSEMVNYVKEDKALSEVPKTYADEAKQKIGALTAEKLNETEGSKEKSPEYYNTFYNAQNAYQRYYRENIRSGMNQNDAHLRAMERVDKNMVAGSYSIKPTASSDQQARINYAKASKAWSSNASLVNTAVLPGTERDLQVLETYAKTGKGSIPYIYYQLAQGHRNLTAWDIANAQLKASGKGSLMKPKAAEYVDQQDPQLQRLLNWRPTPARSNRVALTTAGYKPMLDLIASKESTSYGGYDAMNSGGAAGGTVAFGSANSKNVFAKGLSQMTIGEVMELQASQRLHAAGRYQIIGKTLKGLVQNGAAGLTVNDRFDQANQDKLATVLIKRRIAERNAMTGLRNEWIGLRKVPDAVLQKAIASLNDTSPFNNPDNLLPKLVYRIGNLGYGSTGPHLDVKPVRAKSLNTDSTLPALTGKELDRYVLVGNSKKPLSQGTVTTDNDQRHRARGSFGHDFAAPDGTPVYLANGARVVGSKKGDQGTDHTIIELPDGRRFQFLHGTNT